MTEAMEAILEAKDGLNLWNVASHEYGGDNLSDHMKEEEAKVTASTWQKGKSPPYRPSRAAVLAYFQASPAPNDELAQTISSRHPPSSRSFSELKAINLKDLCVEEVHEDSYIILRYAQVRPVSVPRMKSQPP